MTTSEGLSHLRHLTYLDFSSCRVSSALQAISECRELQVLKLNQPSPQHSGESEHKGHNRSGSNNNLSGSGSGMLTNLQSVCSLRVQLRLERAGSEAESAEPPALWRK